MRRSNLPSDVNRSGTLTQRVYLFLGMLFHERARQRVLVVSQGGALRVFRHLLECRSHDEFVERRLRSLDVALAGRGGPAT